MNRLTAKVFVLFLLSGFIYAEEPVTFKKQIIQVPMNTADWVWPYWKDINKDGLTDLLVLLHNEEKAFTYIQSRSGFPNTPAQTITFPPAAMWLTVFNVNEHPGDELLISTSKGLVYYFQDNGIFEIKPEKLIDAEQIVPKNHPPIIIEPAKWPEDSKNTIPVIFSDHTVIYKVNGNYQLEPVRKVEHEFKKSISKEDWNNWSIGSRKSDQLGIRIVAQGKIDADEEKEPEKENESIEKLIKKIKKDSHWWGDHGIEKKDINADGRQDLVLWSLDEDIDPRTTISVFIRQANGSLPEKPNQILRCRGIPINVSRDNLSISLFDDINNDGLPELILLAWKIKPLSASTAVEALVSKGLECVLSIRQFKKPGKYSKKADFNIDITTMLPASSWLLDMISIEGDFNNDGRKDIIVRRTPAQFDIYLSSETTSFYDPKSKLQLEVPTEGQKYVEDLNNDGMSDIYLIDYEKGEITLFLSEPLNKKDASHESQ